MTITGDSFLIGGQPVNLDPGDRVQWDASATAFAILRGMKQMAFTWTTARSGAKLWVGGDRGRAIRFLRLMSALRGLPLLRAQESGDLVRIFGRPHQRDGALQAGFYLDGLEVGLEEGDCVEWRVEQGSLSFRRGGRSLCISGYEDREDPHSLILGDGCTSALHLVSACASPVREIARIHGAGICYELQAA